MKRINKAVVDKGAPPDSHVFWVDTENPDNPVLKVNIDGVWKAVAGSSDGPDSGGGGGDGTSDIPSIILEYGDEDTFVQKNGGFISRYMGTDPLSVTLKLSTGEPCSNIEIIPITTTAMEAESHASIELVDESTGEWIITPAEYDGSHPRIVDTYLLAYTSSEQVDGKNVVASFYIVIQSERAI